MDKTIVACILLHSSFAKHAFFDKAFYKQHCTEIFINCRLVIALSVKYETVLKSILKNDMHSAYGPSYFVLLLLVLK